MGACIDRYSLRRSCSCWYLRRFWRSTAEATRLAAGMGLVAVTAGLVAVTWAAATHSVGDTPALVLHRDHPRAALLPVHPSPRAASIVALIILASVCDSEPTASGTTATDTGIMVTRGCMAGSTIRTGGGILVRG